MKTIYSIGIVRKRQDKILDVAYPNLSYQDEFFDLLLSKYISDDSKYDGIGKLSQQDILEIIQNIDNNLEFKDHHNSILLQQLSKNIELENINNKDNYHEKYIVIYVLKDANQSINSVEQAFFKLHAISNLFFKPTEINLDNIFATLNNLAWTNYGPILLEDLKEMRIKYLFQKVNLIVSHIDKFPYLVDYIVPIQSRITDRARVRLGAYIGKGTTVMPAGYINFNAGTAGNAMVEGRVSAGVFVGENTDIGGGASIMGTLSGGNNHVISIGSKCLLGANSGVGISLGYGCSIAAGLYIYAGMKIYLYNQEDQAIDLNGKIVKEEENIFKAMELSGRDYLLFIQDSRTGKVICKPNKKVIELNKELHNNL